MAKTPRVFSRCERSPWYDRTWSENAFYGEYAGRLVLLSLGNDAVDEYWALRRGVGLFDVPERPLEISGVDARRLLNRLLTRPVDRLRVGRGSYGLLCHQRGGMVCDGILFRIAEDRYWYVHADADVFTWLVAHAHGLDVDIRDPKSWVLQVQGPKSMQVLANACDGGAPERFNYFDIFEGRMGGQPVLVSRTGWSAELGFEVYNLDPDVDGPGLWDHLMLSGAEQRVRPCSQLSMNIRRIEGGILNYPTDMDWHTTPYDMGLGLFVDLEHDFVGRDALRRSDPSPLLQRIHMPRGKSTLRGRGAARWPRGWPGHRVRNLALSGVRGRLCADRFSAISARVGAHRGATGRRRMRRRTRRAAVLRRRKKYPARLAGGDRVDRAVLTGLGVASTPPASCGAPISRYLAIRFAGETVRAGSHPGGGPLNPLKRSPDR